MKKMFVKIRDLAEAKLRRVCAGLSPEKRVITIVVPGQPHQNIVQNMFCNRISEKVRKKFVL